jgi:AcrR family transcriptional regulator
MINKTSKLEALRQNGDTQVEAQRISILDAAEKLFLEKGLENTSMKDIADEAGVTRMTLYRYFPDRDPIAFEIAVRMLHRIAEKMETGERPLTLEVFRKTILRMIDHFYPLRNAFRYIGMFDHLYGRSYPNETLANWFKEQLFTLGWGMIMGQAGSSDLNPGQAAMIGNSAMSFLEKMAARGEILANEQDVALDEQLAFYKDMVNEYIDGLARKEKGRSK